LEQAAAYAQASSKSLSGYLALFQRRRADLLTRGKPTGYPATVATTWALAFAHLEQSAPAAVGLLRLLACCAPEAIPLRLLLQPRRGFTVTLATLVANVLFALVTDELAAGDAVAALREYWLARPAGDGAVSVHRLVQAVTADQMPDELRDAWRQAAALIEAALPGDPQQPGTWPAFAALLPHARPVLDITSDGMEQITSYLGNSGSYQAARDLAQLVADARTQDDAYGPEHPDTLMVRSNLASWTLYAGDAAGARDQFAALLPVHERVLGPEHPETLAVRNNLASSTGEAEDAAGPGTSTRRCCPSASGCLAPSTPTP
jgi:hypothetical protein